MNDHLKKIYLFILLASLQLFKVTKKASNIITADFDPAMLEELISIRTLTSQIN